MAHAAIVLFPHGRLTFGDFSESHVSQVVLVIFARDADAIRAKLRLILGVPMTCATLVGSAAALKNTTRVLLAAEKAKAKPNRTPKRAAEDGL
jgi:hypothetical protein